MLDIIRSSRHRCYRTYWGRTFRRKPLLCFRYYQPITPLRMTLVYVKFLPAFLLYFLPLYRFNFLNRELSTSNNNNCVLEFYLSAFSLYRLQNSCSPWTRSFIPLTKCELLSIEFDSGEAIERRAVEASEEYTVNSSPPLHSFPRRALA